MRKKTAKMPGLDVTTPINGFDHWATNQSNNGPVSQLYAGDACAVLRVLRPNHVSCVVTSPPYFWQRDYDVVGQIGLEPTVDAYVQSVCDVMDEVKRVLHPEGVVFLNLGDTYYSAKGRPQGRDPKHNGRRFKVLRAVDTSGLGKPQKTLLGMPWRVALAMIDRDWILRAPIVWRRENAIPEPNVKDRPWRTYEFVFLFSKSRDYRFQRGPLKSAGIEDVWTVESRANGGKGHPAAFPQDLVRQCLKLGNPTKGIVLDPFVGSGTVLRVASELGMPAIGIDLNPRFCQKIANDLELVKDHASRSG